MGAILGFYKGKENGNSSIMCVLAPGDTRSPRVSPILAMLKCYIRALYKPETLNKKVTCHAGLLAKPTLKVFHPQLSIATNRGVDPYHIFYVSPITYSV